MGRTVEEFKKWFDTYTRTFIGRNEDLDFAVSLKQEHTYNVLQIITELSTAVKLGEKEVLAARLCALLHDVGRFPQFARYGTFKDTISKNHALLGLAVLEDEGVLNTLDEKTAELIRSGVKYHNSLKVPDTLSRDEQLITRLLRDADKIDIYRVTSSHYSENSGTGGTTINLGLPATDEVSPSIVEAVASRESVSYEICESVNDFKLLQLGWIYDINFSESLRLLHARGYIDILMGTLPAGPGTERIRKQVSEWIEKKVQGPPAGWFRLTSE